MIFYWLQSFFARLRWLAVPPSPRDVARIDPNAKCPGCGNESGAIACIHKSVWRKVDNTKPATEIGVEVLIKHTCEVCGAQWFENPIVKASPDRLLAKKDEQSLRAA